MDHPAVALEPIFDKKNQFDKIINDLSRDGFSINKNALPAELSLALFNHLQQMHSEKFSLAGIGRGNSHKKRKDIRKDKICWITGTSQAGRDWIEWCEQLQTAVNRELFLGLRGFESHFAHYQAGDYYLRHYDAFRGEQNRVLTVVAYFNHNWNLSDGGELILYRSDEDELGIRVLPEMGTIAVFLSEEFPHEVKPTWRDRYSIAGWYRVTHFDPLL